MAIDALAAAERRPHPWAHTGPAMFDLEAARERMAAWTRSVRSDFASAKQRERDLRQRPT